jgi:hypothetical protein
MTLENITLKKKVTKRQIVNDPTYETPRFLETESRMVFARAGERGE